MVSFYFIFFSVNVFTTYCFGRVMTANIGRMKRWKEAKINTHNITAYSTCVNAITHNMQTHIHNVYRLDMEVRGKIEIKEEISKKKEKEKVFKR